MKVGVQKVTKQVDDELRNSITEIGYDMISVPCEMINDVLEEKRGEKLIGVDTPTYEPNRPEIFSKLSLPR